MSEHSPQIATQFIDSGKYFDYMPLWYSDVGAEIVQTMLINVIKPFFMLIPGFAVPWLKQKMDRKWTNDIYSTKKTSMAGYKTIYLGGEFKVHTKYSQVLNIIFITLFYGSGMPLLFPLSALNLFAIYITERISITYLLRLPPSLDDKLIRTCIKILGISPILFIFNAYWMYNNR